ncbi:2-polyprenyl-6-methoxyphenol hydroxylase-like FAD-dependent oxidoreductase [Micromonospora palomenae]|uniref:2-polyprenyl-6-methoxyphenol hydroxylase-like FAD-dependent oxidoreductase n=1 Tax=Micromonospora palomenae TaxID=1461247 RepID=A0A561WY26_9ACTN|nr:FAD-dependent oxidoreductase [Micromonospora palomenae]TWG28759.1 2-polyprenyl-6-methoxyphenol hydroxylase-like FAD-dependent oxidoreductase [Micromonospora palomenae]
MPPSPSRLFAEIATAERPAGTTMVMRRAVVLGGSIAGLMAARVLSDHAEEVLIIERDPSDVDDGPRPGVPQGSQVHALLPAGQIQLERWFPGIVDEAHALGAPPPPTDEGAAKIFVNGVLGLPPAPSGSGPTLITTRPFLEALVRRRTLAVDNIRMVYGRADGLVFADRRVAGARYVPEGGGEPVVEPADLVVDAMGRSSRLGDWLADNGWPRPPMQRMPIKLNYATALFKQDEKVSDAWVVVYHTMAGKGRTARIGGINSVEGDRWIMLVAGYDEDRPSRDVADFTARCREHYPQMFGDIAEYGEMLGGVVTYHQADSRRRDFHKLDRMPAGLVAAGDAIASFNPVYGQGMTSAMLHASCLSAYLRSSPNLHEEPARAYFERVRVIVDAAWQTSTTADIELPHVDGPYPPGYRVTKWFGDLLFRTSLTDPVLSARLGRVTTMLDHPATLSRPGTLLRALRLGLFRRRAATGSTDNLRQS